VTNLTVSMNCKIKAVTQYADFNFNSFCRFKGKVLGANSSGIFELGQRTGETISAYFNLMTSNFGIPLQKRIRAVRVRGEAATKLTLTLTDDEGDDTSRDLLFEKEGGHQSEALAYGRRGSKGMHWSIQIANQDGSDFSIDEIRVTPVVLASRRPFRFAG